MNSNIGKNRTRLNLLNLLNFLNLSIFNFAWFPQN